MTPAGWLNLILSVGAVTLLFAWCLYKVLTHNPPAEPVLEDLFHDEDVPSDKA